MFSVLSTVRLHHTDAAGVLFFGDYFRLAHDAYEDFLESIGYSISHVLENAESLLLIVHAESDYRRPLHAGEHCLINVTVERIGGSSFILAYTISSESGSEAANLRTVHVAADRTTGKKCPLPADLVEKLRPHLVS